MCMDGKATEVAEAWAGVLEEPCCYRCGGDVSGSTIRLKDEHGFVTDERLCWTCFHTAPMSVVVRSRAAIGPDESDGRFHGNGYVDYPRPPHTRAGSPRVVAVIQ